MFARLRVMLIKEFLQLRRDPWALFFLIVPLLIQVVLFGYAANFSVNHVATVVLDLDRSQVSRELVSHFAANGRFDIVDIATNDAQVTSDLDAGRVVVAIVIHAGFARNLGNGKTGPLEVAVDGTNSNTALIALGYVSLIVAQFQAGAMAEARPASNAAAVTSITVALQDRPWFNDELNDHWFFIPGVIGTLTLLQVVSLTAFAVVREREVGTLEQIMVSPIRPIEFILGKTVPFFLIGLGDVTLVTVFGVEWFGIPFVGNPLVLLVGASLFLLAALGLGLMLSTFSRTQQQAFALTFILLNPLYILSGFAYPIAAMPAVLRWFTLINPLRYFLEVIRSVMLKGVGVDVLWQPLAAMALLGLGMLTASVLRFRKSMD